MSAVKLLLNLVSMSLAAAVLFLHVHEFSIMRRRFGMQFLRVGVGDCCVVQSV